MAREKGENNATAATKSFNEIQIEGSARRAGVAGDRGALAQVIAEYICDSDRRLRHGCASRDRVVSLFSISTMVDKYRLLYESALGVQAS